MENNNISEKLFLNFQQVAILMQRGLHRFAHDAGGSQTSPGQGRLLEMLHGKDFVNQQKLGEMLGIRSGSLSELIGKLEKNGLVKRQTSETDRRSMDVRLTESGKAMIANIEKERNEIAWHLFGPLSPQEQEILNPLLTKLISAWQELDEHKKDDSENIKRKSDNTGYDPRFFGAGRARGFHGYGNGGERGR